MVRYALVEIDPGRPSKRCCQVDSCLIICHFNRIPQTLIGGALAAQFPEKQRG